MKNPNKFFVISNDKAMLEVRTSCALKKKCQITEQIVYVKVVVVAQKRILVVIKFACSNLLIFDKPVFVRSFFFMRPQKFSNLELVSAILLYVLAPNLLLLDLFSAPVINF